MTPVSVLAIVGLVALAWVALVALVWLYRPSWAIAGPALRLIPDLVRLTQSLLRDQATPRSVKLALGGLLVYLLSPIDLIPDVIPVVGSVDDLAIAALVLRWAGRRLGPDQLRRHWAGGEAGYGLLLRLIRVAP